MAESNKVVLWAVPRSISTAFFRAMMNNKNVKVLLEPYSKAYYFGTERISERYKEEPIQDGYTFKDMKVACEEDSPGIRTVFVKDMAYYLRGRLSTPEYLPEGFIHTFLIRDPNKAVLSLYKMSLDKSRTGWDHFDPAETGYGELYEMFELVTETLGQKAIVVDADDLLEHPESILRQYCDKTGITFDPRMLNWEDTPPDMSVFSDWMPWFEGVLTTKKFTPAARSPCIGQPLPQHVQQCIAECSVPYKKMHSQRILPGFQ